MGLDSTALPRRERTGVRFQRPPADASEFDFSSSEMRPLIEGFAADRANLLRTYSIEGSSARDSKRVRMRAVTVYPLPFGRGSVGAGAKRSRARQQAGEGARG